MEEQADNDQFDPERPPVEASSGSDQPQSGQSLTIVGIGASAGGLTALQGFFETLADAAPGLAFVVITHMAPDQESLLPELLQSHTAMPVHAVTGPVPIEDGHVYVISPNRRLLVTGTHLETRAFAKPRGRRTPVDDFFRSLATVHGDATQPPVAVILSGGGTDGAVGVKSIKEAGGLLMAQNPAEAEVDSMPRAAIATGLVDVVGPVAELAHKLVAYHTHGVALPASPEALTEAEIDSVYRILGQVQAQTGHDFTHYRPGTLLRRIQRRLQLNDHRTLDGYLANLRHDEAEARILFGDLLVGVTNFFRDKDSWAALAEKVIPRLFAEKQQGDTVRVWSIGCSTGEEAYSLAILLLEVAATLERPPALLPGIQVFASDLDDGALNRARQGSYPEAIEVDVSPERLVRWFVKEDDHYRIRREVRDIVLFGSHNVLRDPPFSHLDLVSCRNLLIYLRREFQGDVFQIFHYALRPGAYLFLGSAESAEMVHDLFRTVDREHRLYRARRARDRHLNVPSLPLMERNRARPQQRRSPAGAAQERALHRMLLEEAAPPSVLVDDTFQVRHISANAGRYLQVPGGTITSDLRQLVRPELRAELELALSRAFVATQTVVGRPVPVRFNGPASTRSVTVAVSARRPAGDEAPAAGELLALVFFLEDEASELEAGTAGETPAEATGDRSARRGAQAARLAQLEGEVRRLRQRLHAATEEHETSTEELKAANEELQSINEEYRTTTEELETSKEELQSLNEELQTVNAELKNQLEEVNRAHGDLENLMAATNIATLFLDRELRIRRYTPATVDLFSIRPGDRGRPIGHLTSRLVYETLAEDARQVLHTLVPLERDLQDVGGRWLLARLRPYRTADDRIEGVVVSFVDVTQLKTTEAALRRREAALSRQLADARLLQQLGGELISEHEPGALYDQILDAALALMGADAATIQRLDPQGEELLLLGWRGLDPPSAAFWERVEAGSSSTCRRALVTGRRIVVHDIERVGDVDAYAFLAGSPDLDALRRSGLRAVQSTPLLSRAGRPLGVISTHWQAPQRPPDDRLASFDLLARQAADLVERARAEEALRASEERFRLSVENLLTPFAIYTAIRTQTGAIVDFRVEYVNEAACALTGRRREAYVGKTILELYPGLDQTEIFDWYVEVVEEDAVVVKESFAFDGTAYDQTTGRRLYDFRLTRLDDGFTSAWRDVTERRQAEQALRQSRERLQLAQEVAGVGTFEWHIPADVDRWSPEIERLYGLPEGTFDGTYQAWAALVHPEDLPQAEQQVQAALETGHFDAEWRAIRPDGHTIWILARGWVEMDAQGEPLRMIGANVDITRRKEAEAALRERERELATLNETLEAQVEARTAALQESEERFRTLVDTSATMVWMADAQGHVVEDSPSWRAYTGQSLPQLLDAGWANAVHPDDRAAALENWARSVHDQTPVNAQFRVYHAPSDAWRWTNMRAAPLRHETGQVRGWIGMNIDIHEQKRAEEEVRRLASDLALAEQAERDRIARLLHDQLQQQLYALRLQLVILQGVHGEGDEAAFAAQMAETEAGIDEAVTTTRRLNVELSPPILADEGLAAALRWLAVEMEEQHQLEVTVEGAPAPHDSFTVADEGVRVLLFRAVRELLFNVVKHAGTHQAGVRLEHEDNHLRITVHDSGRGFDTETVQAGSGRSSGLATLRHRLSLVGGELEIDTRPGDGAHVTITVPLRPPTSSPRPTSPPAPSDPG